MARLGTALAVAGTLVGLTGPAASANGSQLSASAGDAGKRWTVCAQDLTVRDAPGGRVIGTLSGPQRGGPAQSFTIQDATAHGGEWVRGHAWGSVNQDGYIQNGWFCSDNTSGSPAAAIPNPPASAATTPSAAITGYTASAVQAAGSASATQCYSPYYASATPKKDSVSPIPIVGNGWRSYSVGISSYLRRCGGYIYARHCVYIDTRNLPYGHKVWFAVSTQRSDGKWARAHRKPILELTGRQEIQETCLHQRRGRGATHNLDLAQVHVRHTATTPGDGALIPRGSTLKGSYQPYYGPEAKPRQ